VCGPALAVAVAAALLATAPASAARSRIAPLKSHPHGATYAEWGARWYQWTLSTPKTGHPLLGGNCSTGQAGPVWFLGGVLGGGTANRTCRVPRGKALFLPTLNTGYFAFVNDPAEQRTPEFVRSRVPCKATSITASIDGVAVRHPERFFVTPEQSPLFEVQLPVDNVLGLTEAAATRLFLSPSAHSGYYLYLRPLSRGRHTITWRASGACPGPDPQSQVVSYRVRVVRRGRA
jgi:hypothetical protein